MLIVMLIALQSTYNRILASAMRYSAEHKKRTRDKIIHKAAQLFRRHGYDGIGIDDIMNAAGLTRGGFYGYFASKADLFVEVMLGEHDFNKRMRAREGNTPSELNEAALGVVAGYLNPDNKTRVGRGCTMASLSVDIARSNAPARQAFTAKVKALAREFDRGIKDPEVEDPRSLAAIALCVGGLVLARATNDTAFSDKILAASEKAAGQCLTEKKNNSQ